MPEAPLRLRAMIDMPSDKSGSLHRDLDIAPIMWGLLLAVLLAALNLGLFAAHSRSASRLGDAISSDDALLLARRSDTVTPGSDRDVEASASGAHAETIRQLAAARTKNARLATLTWACALISMPLLIAIALWSRRAVHRLADSRISDTSTAPASPDKEVHARAAELTQLSRHLIRVAEEEKAELARELHDTFGSNLTAINMDLNWIAKRLPAERPELRDRLQRALGMLSSTVSCTQEAIDRLRPSQLDNLGLAVALRSHCRELAQRVGLACQVDAAEDFGALDRMRSITLYRVAQEALANVEKHAKAATVAVELVREERGIRLRIWDDGIGLPDERSAPSHGMACMRERIEALGGTLNVTGARERGTQVDAFIPASAT